MAESPDPSPLRRRLRAELTAAMRGRDRMAVSVLRTTLAAIDNAEAIEVATPVGHSSLAIEAIPLGAGAAEAERRSLTDEDIEAIVHAELTARLAAATEYATAGRQDHAERLRAEAVLLAGLLER